jgi:hypothetical protein
MECTLTKNALSFIVAPARVANRFQSVVCRQLAKGTPLSVTPQMLWFPKQLETAAA